eukprot:CAMPEP_0181085082 /NCGR_PEP_ID=MMETSP1071-20121207/5044_1 /TAXON_ID=35127 /ORGANISM="Thalassiosira sp., Strain NH16" /LENGTH=615 /DNA_ID=CAMNT_0023166869 /DNA_START=341 /DNA_END=2187 /DNA_ORIENTATION=+
MTSCMSSSQLTTNGGGVCSEQRKTTAAAEEEEQGDIYDDEEIASVEADGIANNGMMDGEGDGTTTAAQREDERLLTAALVTSIAESAGGDTTDTTTGGPAPSGGTRRRRAEGGERAKSKPGLTNGGHHDAVPNPLAKEMRSASQAPTTKNDTILHPPPPSASTLTFRDPKSVERRGALPPSSRPPPPKQPPGVTSALMSAAPIYGTRPRGDSTVQFAGQLLGPLVKEEAAGGSTTMATATRGPGGGAGSSSIDLDPAIWDMVENSVDPLAGKGREDSYEYVTGRTMPSGRDRGLSFEASRNARDRGFSFEFFSFGAGEDGGQNNETPLSPVPSSSACDAAVAGQNAPSKNQQRPRGDSIIFDPMSFLDGGIHETSALLHIDQEGGGNRAAATSIEIPPPSSVVSSIAPAHDRMTMTGFTPRSDHPLPGCAPIDRAEGPHRSSVYGMIPSNPESSRIVGTRHHNPEPRKSKSSTRPPASLHARAAAAPPCSENTIHMPHGSDAAAAAAAGMPQTATASDTTAAHRDANASSSSSSAMSSHTSCPMELLNKGGRIGIYLPDERRARIAKFHSKRKIRIWRKRIKYDCRKKLADSRPRIKGRFVKRSDVDVGGDNLSP